MRLFTRVNAVFAAFYAVDAKSSRLEESGFEHQNGKICFKADAFDAEVSVPPQTEWFGTF